MFIVWGRKITRRPLGFVADFCGICREPRAFRLSRLGSAGHVYYISFGEGDLVGHERTCTTCGTFSSANVNNYAAVSRKAVSLEALKKQTFPDLDAALEDQRALDERVKTAPHLLSPAERLGLIRSPLNLLSPKVEKRFASTHIDGGIVLALAGAIGLLAITPAIVKTVAVAHEGRVFIAALILGAALVIWQFIAAGQRFMRKQVMPILAKSLAPLKPSEAEINQALLDFRKAGHQIGRRLKASEVFERTSSAQ